jgi:hypothetical protein
MRGGHLFPEENPDDTAVLVKQFLSAQTIWQTASEVAERFFSFRSRAKKLSKETSNNLAALGARPGLNRSAIQFPELARRDRCSWR